MTTPRPRGVLLRSTDLRRIITWLFAHLGFELRGNIRGMCEVGGGGTWVNWLQRGPKGSTGPAGASGSIGGVGPPGENLPGARGERGDKGDDGDVGDKGDDGPPGDKGADSNEQGDQGDQGDKGIDGIMGPAGADSFGPRGPDGEKGDQGPPGSKTAILAVGPRNLGLMAQEARDVLFEEIIRVTVPPRRADCKVLIDPIYLAACEVDVFITSALPSLPVRVDGEIKGGHIHLSITPQLSALHIVITLIGTRRGHLHARNREWTPAQVAANEAFYAAFHAT